MVQPRPMRYKCEKCGYIRVCQAESDTNIFIPIEEITCPTCNTIMSNDGLASPIDIAMSIFLMS